MDQTTNSNKKTPTKDKNDKPVSKIDKEGSLFMSPEEGKPLKKYYLILNGSQLSYYVNPKDTEAVCEINVEGAICREADIRTSKKAGLKLLLSSDISSKLPIAEIESRPSVVFYSDNKEEIMGWIAMLNRAILPYTWPKLLPYCGNDDVTKEYFNNLPKLKDTVISHRLALLYKKLCLCSVIFTPPENNGVWYEGGLQDQWDLKRTTLLELMDSAESMKGLFGDSRTLNDTFYMISANIFRSLPLKVEPQGMGEEEEAVFTDPLWQHLHIVYELLLRLVTTTPLDQTLLRKCIDTKFIVNLIELFKSEDMKEREILKTVTHRIYGKLTHRRTIIRKTIYNAFFEFIFEGGVHPGIAQLLEILASIINGFALPLRAEHKDTLIKTLIPLHKSTTLDEFQPQLSYCMTLYAKKEPALAKDIVMGLLRYWPVGNSAKEIYFLNELEELFETIDAQICLQIATSLFKRLAKCLKSDHFQVCERALFLWHNPRIASLLVEDRSVRVIGLPLIYKPLYTNSMDHWHDGVKQLSQHILGLYLDVDGSLYDTLRSSTH